MDDLIEEDAIINKPNKYHKEINSYVDVRGNIFENITLFTTILVPIIVMFMLFQIKNKKKCRKTNQNMSNVMFSLMLVSLLLTVAELIYIYGFNVENNYNQLSKVIDKNIGFNEYLDVKQLNNTLPNVIFNDDKSSYESNLQTITFLMFVPILLISIFMLTSLTGCLKLSYNEMTAIFINFLILLTIFSITFVNLGIFQSDPVNYKEISDSFDPHAEVHRFQTEYSFMSDPITITLFLALLLFIAFFIGFVYLKK
tara:strand:+ start:762 stop:1526 length:765 start_codon:yes stop_codon:yes gene_type:complete